MDKVVPSFDHEMYGPVDGKDGGKRKDLAQGGLDVFLNVLEGREVFGDDGIVHLGLEEKQQQLGVELGVHGVTERDAELSNDILP